MITSVVVASAIGNKKMIIECTQIHLAGGLTKTQKTLTNVTLLLPTKTVGPYEYLWRKLLRKLANSAAHMRGQDTDDPAKMALAGIHVLGGPEIGSNIHFPCIFSGLCRTMSPKEVEALPASYILADVEVDM